MVLAGLSDTQVEYILWMVVAACVTIGYVAYRFTGGGENNYRYGKDKDERPGTPT